MKATYRCVGPAVFMLASLLAGSGVLALTGAQTHYLNAKQALTTAANELNASGGDTSGYTATALNDVRQAISELKMACGAPCADPAPPSGGGVHKIK